MPLQTFPSLADYGRHVAASGARFHRPDTGWTDGENRDIALRRCAQGDDRHVSTAEALLDKINTGLDLDRAAWVPSVAGAYPIVPEALLGLPTSMRRRIQQPNEAAPIKIYVSLTSSAGVKTDHLVRRGTAILALAMALAAQRPLELHGIVTLGHAWDPLGDITAIRINTAPLDLSEACYTLTSQGLARGLAMGDCQRRGNFEYGSWPRAYHAGAAQYLERVRGILRATPHDVILQPADIRHDATMLADPVAWINATIADIRARLDQ